MDINTRNLKYALKKSIKQEQCIKYSLYFKCGSNFYFFNYCSVPMPKYNLQTANTTAVYYINLLVIIFNLYLILALYPVSTTYKDEAIINIL